MAENPVATCAANHTTIYGSHGVSSITYVATGKYYYNFDSTTQGYRTTSWDACNITQSQTPNTGTSTYRHLQRYNYHTGSNQTRVYVSTSRLTAGGFYGYFYNPGYHTLVSTSGGTQDVSECDVVAAVRFSTNASISQWETGISSVSDQGTGILRVNWTTEFQNNFSDYRAAAIVFQSYISGGYNAVDMVYGRAATYIDIQSADSNGTRRNQANCSLMAFKT